MSNVTIEKIGTVIVTDDGVTITGFVFDCHGTEDIRKAAIAAIDYAISVLQKHKEDGADLRESETTYLERQTQ